MLPGLAAAEGQVDELALTEEEVGADWKTAALIQAIIEKLLRVVEFGQAQILPRPKTSLVSCKGRNACVMLSAPDRTYTRRSFSMIALNSRAAVFQSAPTSSSVSASSST